VDTGGVAVGVFDGAASLGCLTGRHRGGRSFFDDSLTHLGYKYFSHMYLGFIFVSRSPSMSRYLGVSSRP
jgi:hypothetical protein